MPSISEVREDRGIFDSREITSDLGKLWSFGMEGEEVALERGQEMAEPEEMGEWGHENGGRKNIAIRWPWVMR